MLILFDHNTPAPLRCSLRNYTVETTAERGWHRLTNGELLDAAEAEGFDILLTAEKGFQHQLNLRDRRIAIIILSRGNWPDVKVNVSKILDAIGCAKGGACVLVNCQVSSETLMKEDAS